MQAVNLVISFKIRCNASASYMEKICWMDIYVRKKKKGEKEKDVYIINL